MHFKERRLIDMKCHQETIGNIHVLKQKKALC